MQTCTRQPVKEEEEPRADPHSAKEVGDLALSLGKFAQAATTKHRRLGGLNRPFLSRRSGDRKPEIRVSAGLVSPEVSLRGLETTVFSLRLHVVCARPCHYLFL